LGCPPAATLMVGSPPESPLHGCVAYHTEPAADSGHCMCPAPGGRPQGSVCCPPPVAAVPNTAVCSKRSPLRVPLVPCDGLRDSTVTCIGGRPANVSGHLSLLLWDGGAHVGPPTPLLEGDSMTGCVLCTRRQGACCVLCALGWQGVLGFGGCGASLQPRWAMGLLGCAPPGGVCIPRAVAAAAAEWIGGFMGGCPLWATTRLPLGALPAVL
jgi:hypothetical protein